jgi:hypothetical protein
MTTPIQSQYSVRRRALLAGVIAATALAGMVTTAVADTAPADLKVVNRQTGQTLQVWRRHGRDYVAGDPGVRYALRVTNHTAGRLLVVLSVDGVNVVSGQTAGFDQRGYVLSPYETYDLTGWRKSDDEVAAFAFAPLPESYAARTGRAADVGVIGMAVFKEKVPPPPPPVLEAPEAFGAFGRDRASKAEAAPPAPARAAPTGASAWAQNTPQRLQHADKLGTAHGEREWSQVSETSFDRSTSYPVSVRTIEYDTYANLVAAGVIPTWRADDRHPTPFPSQPDSSGFVPDPPDD